MYKINIDTPLKMDKNQKLRMEERTIAMKYNFIVFVEIHLWENVQLH